MGYGIVDALIRDQKTSFEQVSKLRIMREQLFSFLSLFLIFFCDFCKGAPNIVLILADDLGYNDVSWHNRDIISPNLEKLARNGIILENHYVQVRK